MLRKQTIHLALALFYTLCSTGFAIETDSGEAPPLLYKIDLNDRSGDTFKVTLQIDDLTAENAIYQFAATAPGTYITMDIGRFVREFQALDADGGSLQVEQLSTNQWKIAEPEKVRQIKYSIAETWDTPVDSNRVYRMCGSSIEDDHVQINGQCVFGYPTGMQTRPLSIDLSYPSEWQLGTALRRDVSGRFQADNFDHVVDSPFLLGRLSTATLQVGQCDVEIYTYSKTDRVKSEAIMSSMEDILKATAVFTDGLPVDHYAFLFHFEDVSMGAWEHSYSSTYTYSEDQFDMLMTRGFLKDNAAHEFYHIVTPLNMHSEIIEQFNFVTPEPSQHLWLYEGATEWAAHMLQLRAGLVDLPTYLKRLSQKLQTSETFASARALSLTQLARRAFSSGYVQLHPDIYMRGAIVAGLLDIRLLELSAGKAGFRELINTLTQSYGPDKAFSETNFFDHLAELSHPEIRDFFSQYVEGNEPLPLQEYYGKLGIYYQPQVEEQEKTLSRGFSIHGNGEAFFVGEIYAGGEHLGFKSGDFITHILGKELTQKNAGELFAELRAIPIDQPYEMTIKRDGEEMMLSRKKIMRHKVTRHVLEIDDEATDEQLALRQAWLQNLNHDS